MKEYRLLRTLRSFLEVAVWIAVVFLVAVFAWGAGIAEPKVLITGTGGFVTTYGVRMVLLMLFMMAGGIIGALFLLARFPRLYKYPVKITAQNVEVQFILAKIMLSSMQLICAVYFFLVMVAVYNMTIELGSADFWAWTLRCLAGVAAVFFVYLFAARKYK